MRKTIIPTLFLGALALSACQFSLSAAPAVPTLSLVEMQATANAIAQAAIAQTMAAMPTATATATPLPPTPTPVLEPTTPTQALVLPSPTATKVSGVDPCNYTSLSTVKGPHVDVVINARLKSGTTQLRYFLRETPFGCGYGVTTLSGSNSTTINIPQGCYDIYGTYYGKQNDHFYAYACFEKRVGTYYALLYPEMIHFSTTP